MWESNDRFALILWIMQTSFPSPQKCTGLLCSPVVSIVKWPIRNANAIYRSGSAPIPFQSSAAVEINVTKLGDDNVQIDWPLFLDRRNLWTLSGCYFQPNELVARLSWRQSVSILTSLFGAASSIRWLCLRLLSASFAEKFQFDSVVM